MTSDPHNESLQPPEPALKNSGLVRGSGTILLVDDEAVILSVGPSMLETMGYTVLTADNGLAAIETYKRHADKIRVVILDLMMPDMDGGEIFDLLIKHRPDVKVLLSSGYDVDGPATEILDRGCKGFIQKPFGMRPLSQKIKEILDGG